MPQNDIDVVRDFVCDSRHDGYNQAYLLWRRSGPSKYVFRFTRHSEERVFIDGEGFEEATPVKAMSSVLANVSWLLGIVLTFVLLCEAGGGSTLVQILRLFGISVRSSLLTMEMYGSQWAIVAVKMIISILKYLLPAIYLIWKFRLPRNVYLPVKGAGNSETVFGFSAAILCGVAVSAIAEISGVQMISRQMFYSYKDASAVITYSVFEIIIAAMLSELLFRGVFLQSLRQFGDGFAIFFVAVIAFLLPNELPFRIGEVLISILSGYCMYRTGSIFTCFIIRIAYASTNLAQLLLAKEGFLIHSGWQLTAGLMALTGVCFIISQIMRLCDKKRYSPLNRVSFMTYSQKLDVLLGSTTMLPWFAGAVLLTILQTAT